MTNTSQKDERYIGRDLKAFPLEIAGSDGSYLIDKNGQRYIDFEMGWCVGNIGWSQNEVTEAIKNFTGPTYVVPGMPGYMYEPWVELAELLAQITPGKLTKSFRATGGTEAVETALQAAMSHTKRHKFISIEGSYHGHSLGAMSVGGSHFREWYPNLLEGCFKIAAPLNDAAAEKVEKLLETKEIAAFIAEPIICNLGVEIPTKEFFQRVAKACKANGTLFIVDEVATGFGRTGKLFAAEHYDLEPDIITLGKALTGGYAALGAAVMTEEVAKSMAFGFSHYSTFGWQPLNAVITLANLRALLKRKDELLTNVAEMSEYFKQRLEAMPFKQKAKVKIKGLAIAVHFEEEGYAEQIVNTAFENKLLLQQLSPTALTIFPNLVIDKSTAKEGLDLLEESI
ncbi:MAG: aspartate aminotransferase family protein [bacterium]|nr:aspartate aminotransferase family protein [bacterium]